MPGWWRNFVRFPENCSGINNQARFRTIQASP
jgi:hypothetical protein